MPLALRCRWRIRQTRPVVHILRVVAAVGRTLKIRRYGGGAGSRHLTTVCQRKYLSTHSRTVNDPTANFAAYFAVVRSKLPHYSWRLDRDSDVV